MKRNRFVLGASACVLAFASAVPASAQSLSIHWSSLANASLVASAARHPAPAVEQVFTVCRLERPTCPPPTTQVAEGTAAPAVTK